MEEKSVLWGDYRSAWYGMLGRKGSRVQKISELIDFWKTETRGVGQKQGIGEEKR